MATFKVKLNIVFVCLLVIYVLLNRANKMVKKWSIQSSNNDIFFLETEMEK